MEACIVKDTICENNRQGGWIALNFRRRIRSPGKLSNRLSPFPGLSELSVHCAVRGGRKLLTRSVGRSSCTMSFPIDPLVKSLVAIFLGTFPLQEQKMLECFLVTL